MDKHGNTQAREGYDRCFCGCKYWEHDRCVDCGTHIGIEMNFYHGDIITYASEPLCWSYARRNNLWVGQTNGIPTDIDIEDDVMQACIDIILNGKGVYTLTISRSVDDD